MASRARRSFATTQSLRRPAPPLKRPSPTPATDSVAPRRARSDSCPSIDCRGSAPRSMGGRSCARRPSASSGPREDVAELVRVDAAETAAVLGERRPGAAERCAGFGGGDGRGVAYLLASGVRVPRKRRVCRRRPPPVRLRLGTEPKRARGQPRTHRCGTSLRASVRGGSSVRRCRPSVRGGPPGASDAHRSKPTQQRRSWLCPVAGTDADADGPSMFMTLVRLRPPPPL